MIKTWYFNNFESLLNSKENDDSYTLDMRAVGLKKNDINIYFDGGVLVVKSNATDDDDDKNWDRHEFWKDSIDKRLVIPEDVDHEKVDAKLEDGILHITLHKTTESQRKLIEVM